MTQQSSARSLDRYRHDHSVVELAGLRLHSATMEQAVRDADQAVRTRRRLCFGMVNIAKLVQSRNDALLLESLVESDMVLADGVPVVWLSRLQGTPLPQRVSGTDLMLSLLQLADTHHYLVYLLGATEPVNEAVARHIRSVYPGCQIAGRHHGFFSVADEEAVARRIRDAGPDMLFVAMSSPKKELFIKRHSEFVCVPVCHGVGGSFDVIAGLTRRAPPWVQGLGCEWLFRVLQEPRRLWKRYLFTNLRATRLIFVVLRSRFFGR
jgi:N-acetylglucosaminyldiphosphoundecaprenol N-acetyl-beta-D-mannosaminyltransferase